MLENNELERESNLICTNHSLVARVQEVHVQTCQFLKKEKLFLAKIMEEQVSRKHTCAQTHTNHVGNNCWHSTQPLPHYKHYLFFPPP